MSDFDAKDTRARYRALMASQRDLLDVPADAPIRILLDDAEMDSAVAEEAARRRSQGRPEGDLRIGTIVDDRYMGIIVRDAVAFDPPGTKGIYNRIIGLDGCLAMPILGGEIVMIRIYRHANRRWGLEFPGGTVAPGVDPQDAVIEELEEEAGTVARTWHPLGSFYPQPALGQERYHLFAAEVDAIGEPQREEGIFELVRLTPGRFEEMIETGEISDLPSLAMFLRARMRRLV